MTLQLECAVSGDGSTVSPCPTGYTVVAIERVQPDLIEDWGVIASISAGVVITLFATGLGVGWVIRMMKGV